MSELDGREADRRLVRWVHSRELPVRYLACPMSCYATERYHDCLRALRAEGREVVVGAANLYRDQAHFERWWPRLLRHISAVSVLAEVDGTVGRGVWTEVHDAWDRAVPVRWEGPGARRVLLPGGLVVVDGGISFRRFARRPGWAA